MRRASAARRLGRAEVPQIDPQIDPRIHATTHDVPFGRRLAAAVPILAWLPRYERAALRFDLLAGATLAAYAIPNAIAYALLAGLASSAGLYGYIACGVAYAVFGTSKQLAVGPTSAISLAVASGIGALGVADPAHRAELAAMLAILVAAIAFGAWLLRGGGIVHFISETVLTGFKIGAGLTIAASQVPRLLGIESSGGGFADSVRRVATHVADTNLASLAVGTAGLVLLVVGRRMFRRAPISLSVVVLSIAATWAFDLESRGVRTTGAIVAGLPGFAVPSATALEIQELLGIAFACFLLAYVEGVAVARTLATRHAERIDVDQELLALSATSLAAGAFHSYPCAGGMGQSTINDAAGARTPLALVCASFFVALAAVFFTGALELLPQPVLAALVIVPMKGLIQVHELRHLFQVNGKEFVVALVALLGVLLLGILPGVMLAAVLSLVFLLQRAANPLISVLGRVPGGLEYRAVDRHPECTARPDVLVIRPNAPLLYFNVDRVSDTVLDFVEACATKPRYVVLDLSFSSQLDVTSVAALGALKHQLARRGLELRLAEVHHRSRARLAADGFGHELVSSDHRLAVHDVVDGCPTT